jgi:hypothetical protein
MTEKIDTILAVRKFFVDGIFHTTWAVGDFRFKRLRPYDILCTGVDASIRAPSHRAFLHTYR